MPLEPPDLSDLPDVRDGLTPKERAVLMVVRELREEGLEAGANRPAARAATIYGRVLQHVDMSEREFMAIVHRLSSRRPPLLLRSQQAAFLRSR